MTMKARTYIVIAAEDITDTMVTESTSTSTSIRYSLDQTQAILKFRTAFPDCMAGWKKYTQAEILQYMQDQPEGTW